MYYKDFSLENIIDEINGVTYVESWMPIKGFKEFYKISSFGRVYSIRSNKIMRQHINDNGYLTISLRGGGIDKGFKVHRLVGIAFIPNPNNKPEINHLDFVKTNNHESNLIWVTNEENCAHAIDGGRIRFGRKVIKEKVGEYPLRCQKIVDTATGEIFENVFQISEITGLTAKYLRKMLSGEAKNRTTYKWLKGQYSLFYRKKHEAAIKRYKELRPKIYGCVI